MVQAFAEADLIESIAEKLPEWLRLSVAPHFASAAAQKLKLAYQMMGFFFLYRRVVVVFANVGNLNSI